MIRQIIFILALFMIARFSYAQTLQGELKLIKNMAQAEKFLDEHPSLPGKIFKLESSSDTSMIILPLYHKSPGFMFTIDKNIYKILSIDSGLSFRVSYIYLDGHQLSKTQIDSIRQQIIQHYKNGVAFTDLVREYSMDGNPTGDTGWFTKDMMVKEFETAVVAHQQGDIFMVDTPSQQWYHVVLKTFDDSYLKTLTLLGISNTR